MISSLIGLASPTAGILAEIGKQTIKTKLITEAKERLDAEQIKGNFIAQTDAWARSLASV